MPDPGLTLIVHNNFYFLRRLSKSLSTVLTDSVVSDCFSQNKNELILRFEKVTDSFFIRASLQPDFSCLTFPAEFNRARKNSVDLFTDVVGQTVTGLRQFKNERSFAVHLTGGYILLFKLHGNKSNVVLFKENRVCELFKKNMKRDLTLSIDSLDRIIDWSYENFITHEHTLEKIYFTFGKIVWKYLAIKGIGTKTPNEKWEMILNVRQQLETPRFFISGIDNTVVLSLLPFGHIEKEVCDPVTALNAFYPFHVQTSAFKKEKSDLLAMLQTRLSNLEHYLNKTESKRNEIEQDDHYKKWADLIMANLHQIKPGSTSIQLPDFYDQKSIDIKLKQDLSPQKNAELYYKKSKNRMIEIEYLRKTIADKQKEMQGLKREKEAIESSTELKTLREKTFALQVERSAEKKPSLPYHEFEYKGFKILVGRNATANDELTLKHAYKEDLWLHAKDVAGSHVLIKFQAGKVFPGDVIERAAEMAAYNSKRKNESLCPVIVVPRKFVRKRKGDPPGAVMVEREKVIMVEPKGV